MAVEVAAHAVLWALVVGVVLAWPPRGGRADTGRQPAGTAARRGVPGLGLRSRDGRSRVDEAWVADFAEVVSVGLRAGLDLGAAATAAAHSPGVVDQAPGLGPRLVEHLAAGRGVAVALAADSPSERPPGRLLDRVRHPQRSWSPVDDLRQLAASWRLTERVGASAAEVTMAAAAAVRARVAARQRASVVLAGPRTSMWLLSALPLGGPMVGTLLGLGPTELYGTSAARVVAGTGLVLTAAGWSWSARLLTRAARPSRTDGTLG
ncbi:MAG: hypothetical protein ACRCY8_20005 [Dermatophilaceae bacterium]